MIEQEPESYGEENRTPITKENYSYSFRKMMLMESTELQEAFAQDESSLHFGPKYHTTTSQNENIDIFTLFIDTHRYYDKRRYLLFALNKNNNLLGYRWTELENDRDGKLTATGRIETAIKGKGYGTCLELANADMLQREADRTGQSFIWRIQDRNYEQLYSKEQDYKETGNQSLLPELEKAREEHARWESIYKNFKGKKEDDPYVPKINVQFSPKKGYTDIESISDIQIRKNPYTESGSTIQEQVIAKEDQKSLRNQRTKEFKNLLEIIEQIAH